MYFNELLDLDDPIPGPTWDTRHIERYPGMGTWLPVAVVCWIPIVVVMWVMG